MGVYIKDMEMPKSCFECLFMLHRCFCLVNPKIEFTDEEYSELKGRYIGCPLVDVPPHGRLGDLDALKKKALIRSERRGRLVNVTDMVISAYDIETAPTIIEAEE